MFKKRFFVFIGCFAFGFLAPTTAQSADAGSLASSEAPSRFAAEIFPLLTRGGDHSCVACHDSEETSSLVLSGHAAEDFWILFEGGYLETQGPDTLLGRLTASSEKRRMPKGKEALPWSPEEIEQLQRFLGQLKHPSDRGVPVDERFPAALLVPFQGSVPAGLDNQFLSYTQLQGKIRTIFHDDGRRPGKDLFAENAAMLGGADFKTRFNESTQPSASFLTALDVLSREVAGRAFEFSKGPFANFQSAAAPGESLAKSDASYCRQIGQLYESILFRSPAESELEAAFTLLRRAYDEAAWIQARDYDLAFELTVTDPATGLHAVRQISIPVNGDQLGVYQELIDQSNGAIDENQTDLRRHVLAHSVALQAEEPGQRLVLHNIGTKNNVSFAGIELRNASDGSLTSIPASDPRVRPEGAWQRRERNGFVSFEDDNVEKGKSRILLPLRVPAAGAYQATILWRQNDHNATNVLVELFGGAANALAKPAAPRVPPAGEAHFFFDSSEDTLPHAELGASFLFGGEDYLEINNAGTRNRVAAGAVDFVSTKDGSKFSVDSKEADGSEGWSEFKDGSFRAYNRSGTQLQDDNQNKGERFLRYRPSVKAGGEHGWQPGDFYEARIHYPGKRDNEPQVPVIVRAQQSSPIVQLASTPIGKAGGWIEIDASASYTVQQSQLAFAWKQTQGVAVPLPTNTAHLKFLAPRKSVEQEAWVALARALMRHPDFLFTRPPSLHETQTIEAKHRLQLVKLALDLVGRPPNPEELEWLARGASFRDLVDRYLESQEFRDFYFHRIRLYLESQGTESQDEPARLWCYVAFHDRPFQEILTADFTVDENFQARPRPLHHGRSGLLTTQGFIEGKPGLPHFNYAAQVSMMFLGYVFEVPPEIVEQREGITALGTTDPNSTCYSCHKILTPLALQRNFWADDGSYRRRDEAGRPIEATDQGLVADYPFKGEGMEAFATQAVKKERFVRTMIDTHFSFYFGRSMRFREDERGLYKRLWDQAHANGFKIRDLIRTLVTSDEYLEGRPAGTQRVLARPGA